MSAAIAASPKARATGARHPSLTALSTLATT
jgi:hypothetical protein